MRILEKQKNLIDFTLSSLLRRKGKNTALLVVYTFMIFLLASVMFFTGSIKKEAALVLEGAPEITVQRLVAGRHDLIPAAYLEAVREIRGVRSAAPRLWGYYYDFTSGANFTLMADESLKDSPGVVHVGSGVLRTLMSPEQGTIPIKASDGSFHFFEIHHVFPAESDLVASDLVLMCEQDYRKVFSIPDGFATDLVLEVRNPKELTTIAGKITQLLPDTRPILRDEILRTYEAVFDWRGGVLVVILWGSVLAFVIFAWDKATGLSAEEKREIGILKAVGWETSDVLVMKFWEGMILSLSSFLTGVVLAYLHVFFSSSVLFEPVLKGWSVLYPDFRLTPFIDGTQLAGLFFLTVVPYTVTTIVPSWRAAVIEPDSVMR